MWIFAIWSDPCPPEKNDRRIIENYDLEGHEGHDPPWLEGHDPPSMLSGSMVGHVSVSFASLWLRIFTMKVKLRDTCHWLSELFLGNLENPFSSATHCLPNILSYYSEHFYSSFYAWDCEPSQEDIFVFPCLLPTSIGGMSTWKKKGYYLGWPEG